MFPQNEMAEYILASTGAALWIVTIIPQIVKSYKTKSTEGLSPWLMALWASSSLFFGSYVIAEKLNLAIQIQPHAFGTLCMISWAQCCYYSRGYSARQAAGYLAGILAIAGAFETTSIFTLWYGQLKGTEVPLLFYGYLSTALTVLGFIPQYLEIYRLGQVKGISLIFLSVDISGGTLSALALFFRAELDIVALITYISVALLDLIIIILYFTLNRKPQPPRSRYTDTLYLSSESRLISAPVLLSSTYRALDPEAVVVIDAQTPDTGAEGSKWVMLEEQYTPCSEGSERELLDK